MQVSIGFEKKIYHFKKF